MAVSTYFIPVLGLNAVALAIAVIALLLGRSFVNSFFLVMLLETAFAFILAGWEDVRMAPLGTLIRKAIFHNRIPYSSARHKEALKTANRLIFIGAAIFAETIVVSLAINNLLAP